MRVTGDLFNVAISQSLNVFLRAARSAPLEVTVFRFKKWPIDGNPEIAPLLEMMGKMDRAHQKKNKAALVMCE